MPRSWWSHPIGDAKIACASCTATAATWEIDEAIFKPVGTALAAGIAAVGMDCIGDDGCIGGMIRGGAISGGGGIDGGGTGGGPLRIAAPEISKVSVRVVGNVMVRLTTPSLGFGGRFTLTHFATFEQYNLSFA